MNDDAINEPKGWLKLRDLMIFRIEKEKLELTSFGKDWLERYWLMAEQIEGCLTKVILPDKNGDYLDPNSWELITHPLQDQYDTTQFVKSVMMRGFFLSIYSLFERDLRVYTLRKCEMDDMPQKIASNWSTLEQFESLALPSLPSLGSSLDENVWGALKIANKVSNIIRHGHGSSALNLLTEAPFFYYHKMFEDDLSPEVMKAINEEPSEFLLIGPHKLGTLLRRCSEFWFGVAKAEGWATAMRV